MKLSLMTSWFLFLTLILSCGAEHPTDTIQTAQREPNPLALLNAEGFSESGTATTDDPAIAEWQAKNQFAGQVPPTAKFVAPMGSDEGPGTQSQPWRSLSESLKRIRPGQTLVIRGGTYTESGRSDVCQNGRSPFALIGKKGDEGAWTTIMGYPGERPRIYNPDGWQTLYVCESAYVAIIHLEIFGDAHSGNDAPTSGVFIRDSDHVVIRDVWSHDNGGCGICSDRSNHLSILGNRVWHNSRWNRHQTSGISIFMASNAGGGNNPDGYSNYIKDNLIWGNFVDESIGEGKRWGITDGNGIIIDRNNDSKGDGRTLIENNIVADNGGPGIIITRSHSVDIRENTLYKNVKTRVFSVMNNGEIGCNNGFDIRVMSNVVIPRRDNPNLFQNFHCSKTSFQNNVWVRSDASRMGDGDIVLPTGSTVLADPRLVASSGRWTVVGQASGRGAKPLE